MGDGRQRIVVGSVRSILSVVKGQVIPVGTVRRLRSWSGQVTDYCSTPPDLTYVDGVLLAELWDELVLPRAVRAAWAPIVGQAMAAAA